MASHAEKSIQKILSKLSGAAPTQTSATGFYIQDGNTLLFQQPNGSLNTVVSEIDTNGLYNKNFDANRNFIVYTKAGSSSPMSIGDTNVATLRNGVINKNPENLTDRLGIKKLIHRGQFNDSFYSLSSGSTFLTYDASQSDWSCPTGLDGVIYKDCKHKGWPPALRMPKKILFFIDVFPINP